METDSKKEEKTAEVKEERKDEEEDKSEAETNSGDKSGVEKKVRIYIYFNPSFFQLFIDFEKGKARGA